MWRLLLELEPPASAAWNMSVDEALLAGVSRAGPTLRLYRFERPAASLGYRQPAPPWAQGAGARGLDLVRRASGGGTVLHAGDLTYAVAAPRAWPELPSGARASYAWVQDALLCGLSALGLAVAKARARRSAARAELCFAASTGAEIELCGRKLVGSAQRRTREGWLQHGSIRLADDSEWYARLLGARAPALAPLPPGLCAQDVAAALVRAFELRAGCALRAGELRLDEKAEAERRFERRQDTPLSVSGFPRTPGSLR
jgi:lipoate-protein ligase A